MLLIFHNFIHFLSFVEVCRFFSFYLKYEAKSNVYKVLLFNAYLMVGLLEKKSLFCHQKMKKRLDNMKETDEIVCQGIASFTNKSDNKRDHFGICKIM